MFGNTKELETLRQENKKQYEEIVALKAQIKASKDEFELKEKKVVAALEDKLSKETMKLEKEYNQKLANKIEALTKTHNDRYEKILTENYEKMTKALAKLHEEGNASTKFIMQANTEILRAVGISRREDEPKQITNV